MKGYYGASSENNCNRQMMQRLSKYWVGKFDCYVIVVKFICLINGFCINYKYIDRYVCYKNSGAYA